MPVDRYAYFRATGSVLVKSGPRDVHMLVLGACTTIGTVNLYDNTNASGNVMYSANYSSGSIPGSVQLDLHFERGLFIQFSTFAGNVTLSYK